MLACGVQCTDRAFPLGAARGDPALRARVAPYGHWHDQVVEATRAIGVATFEVERALGDIFAKIAFDRVFAFDCSFAFVFVLE